MKDKKLSLADYGVDFYKMTDQEILDFLKENEQSAVSGTVEMLLFSFFSEEVRGEWKHIAKEAFENKKRLNMVYIDNEDEIEEVRYKSRVELWLSD